MGSKGEDTSKKEKMAKKMLDQKLNSKIEIEIFEKLVTLFFRQMAAMP